MSIGKSINLIYHINRSQKIISLDAERSLIKFFMIKFLETLIQGSCFNIIKAVYSQPIAMSNNKLKGDKLKVVPVKS